MKQRFSAFFIVLVLALFRYVNCCSAAVDATEVIAAAEEDLIKTYVEVRAAEEAGANVTDLVVRLEDAADFLSKAYNAYRTREYDRASELAANCSDRLNGVADRASDLKMESEWEHSAKLFVTVGVTGAVLCLLLYLGLIGWRFVKNRYFKRVLEMNPGMVEDD